MTRRSNLIAGVLVSLAAACTAEAPPETNLAHNKYFPPQGGGGSTSAGGAGGGGATGTGGSGGAAPKKSSVGNACTSDAECTGYDKPSCLTELKPLKGKITDPTNPSADKFENQLVLPFPNGYCTTTIADSCPNDAACGDGGGCFRGLEGVDKAQLAMLDAMPHFLPFSTVQFADVGICLKPCTTDDDCRKGEGYTCAIPMGSLITIINPKYMNTYCVGPFTFML